MTDQDLATEEGTRTRSRGAERVSTKPDPKPEPSVTCVVLPERIDSMMRMAERDQKQISQNFNNLQGEMRLLTSAVQSLVNSLAPLVEERRQAEAVGRARAELHLESERRSAVVLAAIDHPWTKATIGMIVSALVTGGVMKGCQDRYEEAPPAIYREEDAEASGGRVYRQR